MKAILWDLDDTLLDTLPGRMRALEHAYEQCLGSKTDPVALWRSHRGGTLEDLGRRLVGPDSARFVATYRDYYFTTAHEVRPYAGVEQVLAAFAVAHIPMCVVTSKIAWGATAELDRAGILQYFEGLVGFDDTDLHKPDPEPVFAALDRLCLTAETDVLFVGDSPADIWAARNAGVRSAAALWGTLDEELLVDAVPDHQARRPTDVMTFARQAVAR
jgi:HAD superfamily hydrolase (TIGR01509 family)